MGGIGFLSHPIFFLQNSGLPITLTLGFCFATVAILFMDSEESCSRFGALQRIPEDQLSTPEEFLALQSPNNEAEDLILVDEEEGVTDEDDDEAEEKEDAMKAAPSESTPLLTTGSIDV